MPPKKGPPAAAGKGAAKAPGGKPAAKGPVGQIAKLKAQMEAKKAAEEEEKRLIAEEEQREREEERLAEEQRKFDEEQKKLDKEANKAEKREGKTKEKKSAAEEALERMKAAGMVVPERETEQEKIAAAAARKAMPKPARKKSATEDQSKKPIHFDPSMEPTEPTQKPVAVSAADAAKAKAAAAAAAAKAAEEEDAVDDWEALMGDDEVAAELGGLAAGEEPVAPEVAAANNQVAEETMMVAGGGSSGGADDGGFALHAAGTSDAGGAPSTVSTITSSKKSKKTVRDPNAELRSPICCVLGHVDTGKTSLLDKIRRTNVQGGEAGGITQQIGATFFPRDSLEESTRELRAKYGMELKVPGLLVIDTPGHESFTNLRSRGSNLCDIAVLVVDIMHGLEPQTKESMKLLRARSCPFIVALNKVDRLFEWEPTPGADIQTALAKQKQHVKSEFDNRVNGILTEFAEQGFNAELYYKNKDVKTYVSLVPTSAHTGEGIADLIMLEIQLVQRFMEGKVTFRDEMQCTVLEVKPVQGFGTTIDVVLVNGTLHYADKIVICGMNGPIVTQIRALLTPQPMKELRVKGEYVHHQEVRAAMGLKISANNLDDAVPGTPLFVVHNAIEEEEAKKAVMKDFHGLLTKVAHHGEGVAVQSSTLGAMEALLSFLEASKIPVSAVSLGPIHKHHLMKMQAMKEKNPKFACVLAFDVPVTKDAAEFADKHGLKIFTARIIYHLFDQFTKYVEHYDEIIKEQNRKWAVFPCQLKINDKIRAKDPIILNCTVMKGQCHPGTPLIVAPGGIEVGKVANIQRDKKDVKIARKGQEIAVSLVSMDSNLTYGRQFDEKSILTSKQDRKSIDALKESFRSEMDDDDWKLIKQLALHQGVPTGGKAAKKPKVAEGAAAAGSPTDDDGVMVDYAYTDTTPANKKK